MSTKKKKKNNKKKSTKKKNTSKFLDLSAFKDGYDFGDITKTVSKSAKKSSQTVKKATKELKEDTLDFLTKANSVGYKAHTKNNVTNSLPRFSSTRDFEKPDYIPFSKERDADKIKSSIKSVMIGDNDQEERTYFQKGRFEDGYDFGDITKTILGTNKDFGVSLGKGIGKIGEGLVDTGAYAVGGLSKLFGNDDFANKTKEFISRNLVDEYRIGEKVANSMPGMQALSMGDLLLNRGETEKASVFGDKTDSLVQSAGQLAGTAGLQAVGVPWFVTTGVTGFGSGTEEAFKNDATYGEAGLYGGITAGSEIAFEKIGGIKFGGKALDTGLLSKAISDKVTRNLVKFGMDAGAEGFEEVATEMTQNIGRGLTYEDEKTMQELLFSEEAMDGYIEAFVGGAVMGGGFNAGKLVQSHKTGRDYDTGLTDNEQKVVNTEVENRTAEKQKKIAVETEIDRVIAERTKHLGELNETAKKNIREEIQAKLDNGELDFTTAKLSRKERTEIEKQVEEDLKAGYIGIDTIESTLSGEKTSRINELRDLLSKTTKDTEKSAIETELRQLEGVRAEELKGLLGKDNFLQESYRQEMLKGESFSRETTDKDSDITKELIESAKFAGMNNTRRMHDLFEYTNKIANDTKTKYGFVNNEQLKQLGHEVEGKTINGLVRVNEDGTSKILINVDSNKAINTIIGHETTHLLEGTAEHKKLVDIVKEYATTKGDYDARLKEFNSLYQGVNADIENEITADLVGDYLFTDEAFITNLSVKDTNIFQKVYDYIKHIYKMATAGSTEARQLEQVKRRFDKAYKQISKTVTNETKTNSSVEADSNTKFYDDTKYSLQVKDKKTIDFLENQEHIVTYKAMQVIDGKLYPPMAEKVKGEDGKYHLANPSELGKWQQAEEDTRNIKLETNKKGEQVGFYVLKKSDGTPVKARYNPYEHSSNLVLNDQFESAYNRDNLVTVECVIPTSEMNGAYKAEYAKDATGVLDWKAGVVAGKIKDNKRKVYLSRYLKPVRILSDAETASMYKDVVGDVAVPFNVVSPSLLKELEKQGVNIDYDGSPMYKKQQKRKQAKAETKYSLTDTNGRELTKAQQEYFKDSKVRDDNGNLKVMYHGTAKGGHTVFEPFGESKFGLFGAGTYFTDNKSIAESYTEKGRGNNKQVYETYLNITNPMDMDAPADYEAWKHYFADADYPTEGTNEQFFKAMVEVFHDEQYPTWEAKDTAMDVIQSMGYDGITHIGGGRVNKADDTRHRVYIAFEPEQIKNVYNTNPTANADIRYSLTDSNGKKLSENQQEYYRNVSPLLKDENGRIKRYYHGTSRGDRVGTIFDPERATSGPMAYFTDSQDIATNYSKDKADTSIAYDSDYDSYETQFRAEVRGKDMSLIDAWRYLPADAKARIKERAEHTHQDWDDYETLVYDEDTNDAGGGFQWQIKEARGNIFTALNEQWLNSGTLFNEEGSYLDVLEFIGVNEEFEKLGYGKPYFKDANYREEKVYEVYLNVTNPFDTATIDEDFLADITDYIDNADLSMYEVETADADMWDKHNRDPYYWLERLERDIEEDTTHAWTSIPDVVTDFLKDQGYDGIVDSGGKNGGIGHQVVIPFYSEQVKNIDNENPTDNPDIRYSISEDDIAPVRRETGRALTEADLPFLEQQNDEAFRNISEDNIPADTDDYYEDIAPVNVENPFEDRDLNEVGNRKVKAYMYENPEVKPFFQEEAEYMLTDLRNSVKGEKFYNDKLYYESSGEQGFFGTKRQTTDDIAYLLDSFSYTYADIEKGLKAIIEDNGAENNAISKRIEFALNDRLMDGYEAVDGTPIPANDEYRALIGNMQIQAYSEANYDAWVKSFAGVEAPAEDVSERKVIEEKPAESKPDIAPVREDARNPYVDFAKQQTEKNIKAYEQESKPKPPVFKEVSPTKKKHGVTSAVDTFYSHWVNRNRQIDKLAKKSKNLEIKFKGDRMNNIAGEIGGDIFTAQTDNYGNRIGKALDAPFEQARKAKLEREFDDYLKHQSNIERHAQDKGSVVDAEVSKQYVSAYEHAYPKFKEWAKDVYTYNQNLLDNAVENGLIDNDLRAYLTGTYGHYVPFYSAEMEQPSIDTSPDEIKSGRPIKRAVGGSDVTLQGVEQAMMKQTYAYMNAIAKNDLYKEIAKSLGTVKAAFDSRTVDNLTNIEDTLYEDESGKYLTAYINGEAKSVKISDELFTELKRDLDTQIKEIEDKLGIITKPLQKVSQLRGKILTTYSPTFIVTNPLKDMQDALLNSKHTMRYIKNIGSALKDAPKGTMVEQYATEFKKLTGQDITTVTDLKNLSRKGRQLYKWYQEGSMWNRFMTSYGNNATQLEYSDGVEIDLKKSSRKAKNKGFLNKLGNANNFMEVMFRYPEFKATLEKGKSFTEALYNAREVTTNFGRGGTISKAVNRNGATFFNTSVQGMDKFFRNFSMENGAKGFVSTVSKAVILGMAPAMLNHILLGGGYDDEYEALPDYVKSNYYLFRRDDGSFLRIPKGRMISVLGSAARLNLEATFGNLDPALDKEIDNKEFLRNAREQIGAKNPFKENIFTPIVQAHKNEAWYGGDIVPYRLQSLPKAEQFDASTDEFSKWLGEKLNVSPYKINYVLDQYSGGIGDMLLPTITPEATSGAEGAGQLLAPIKDKFVVNSTDDNRYIGELYDLSDELRVKNNSSNATLDDEMNYKYISDIASEMNELYKLKREIQADITLSKSEKYEETRKIQELINDLASEGVRNYQSGDSLSIAYEQNPEAMLSVVYDDYKTYKEHKYAMWDIYADKDEDGNSIRGSRKEKVIDYINESDLDYGESIILFKMEYPADDTYNEDIIDYLNSRDDISYEEMETILEQLDFTVHSDGTIEW